MKREAYAVKQGFSFDNQINICTSMFHEYCIKPS